MNERELYNLIRNCQIQDHLMALREAQYYATLSDYYLLLDKRLWHSSRLNDLFMRTEDMSLIVSHGAIFQNSAYNSKYIPVCVLLKFPETIDTQVSTRA